MAHSATKLLKHVVQSSIDGILAFDADCRYTVWNRAMENLSGVSATDCIGKIAFEVFPFLVEIGEDKYFYEALRGNNVESLDRPFKVPTSNRRGWFEGFYSPIRDDNDNILGGLAVIRDITQRRTNETQWHQIAARMEDRRRRISELTVVERQALKMLVQNLDRDLIAKQMDVSLRTVQRLRTSIENKLGLTDRNVFSMFLESSNFDYADGV